MDKNISLHGVFQLSSCKGVLPLSFFGPSVFLDPAQGELNPSPCSRCSFFCDWCRVLERKTSGRWSYGERTGGTAEVGEVVEDRCDGGGRGGRG